MEKKDKNKCKKAEVIVHREYESGPMDIKTIDLDVCEKCSDLKQCSAWLDIKTQRALGFRR